MPLVAITRALGSRGTEIAQGVAAKLAVPIVHSEVARRVSERWGIDVDTVADFKFALNPRAAVSGSLAEKLVGCIRQAVLEISCQAPGAVFRGWGAAQFLRTVPHAVCVFIGAPFGERVQRIRVRLNCKRRTAEEYVAANDELRERLARDHAGFRWMDAENYDAYINTGRLSVEAAVGQIVALARCPDHAESGESICRLQNLRCEAATRAALLNDRRTQNLRLFLKAGAENLYVSGIVDDRSQREIVLQLIERANPRLSITSNLRAPSDYRTRSSSI
ncbi:MAG TPA: cytidylate kinase-like family protein [Burkholderiales bacterium]